LCTFNEDVGGVKTFTNIPVLPASDPTANNEATRKAYVDGKPYGRGAYSAIVYKDGSYTVAEDSKGTQISKNTNSRIVIQAAIDALTAGGNIYLKKGIYEIDNQINLNEANVTLQGEGAGSVLKQTATYNVILNVTTDHVSIDNLKIDGNNLGYASIVYDTGTKYGRISNCLIQDVLVRGITCKTVESIMIENNKILNSGGDSISIETTCSKVLVRGNIFINPGHYAIRFYGGVTYSSVIGNTVKNATCFGIAIHSNCDHCNVVGNTVDGCGLDNINVDAADFCVVSGNISNNSNESGIVFFNNCNYAAITGNICDNNNHMGFDLACLRYSTITGNFASRNSQVGVNTWSGIQLHHSGEYQTTMYNCVCGNVSTGSKQQYGIEMCTPSDDYNVVVGNNCHGNATGGVYNPTSNSEVAHNLS
jgi:ribonuclease HI